MLIKCSEYLTNHEGVEWVTHPDLPDHPDHKVAKKILPKGSGSIIAFGVKGGRRQQVKRLLMELSLLLILLM